MGKKKPGDGRMMFCRRLPVGLIERLRRYVATITPRTTDTAVLEGAIRGYLDRHEFDSPNGKGTTMNAQKTTIPTVIDLEHQWRHLGFTEGAPSHVPADLVAVDVRIYRRLACPRCGHRSHSVQPMQRGRVYRLLCRCKKCSAGVEA